MQILRSIGAFAVLLLSTTSGRGDDCDPTFVQQHRTTGLWAFDSLARTNGGLTPGAWIDVSKNPSLSSNGVQKFAYVGRTMPPATDRQGALSVKFVQMTGVGDDRVSQVILRRSTAGSSCGVRRAIQFFALPLDLVMGQQVDVSEYIAYHASESRSNSTLQRFHVNYSSQGDGCVSSDSAKGNRRTAFLAEYDGKPIPASDEMVAALKQYLAPETAVAADNATNGKSVFKLPGIIAREAMAFRQFAAVESQIHTYNLNGRVCVAFSKLNPVQDKSVRIDIVDLDDSATPRRKHWMINWR